MKNTIPPTSVLAWFVEANPWFRNYREFLTTFYQRKRLKKEKLLALYVQANDWMIPDLGWDEFQIAYPLWAEGKKALPPGEVVDILQEEILARMT